MRSDTFLSTRGEGIEIRGHLYRSWPPEKWLQLIKRKKWELNVNNNKIITHRFHIMRCKHKKKELSLIVTNEQLSTWMCESVID